MIFKRFLIIFSLFLSLLLPLMSIEAQTTTTRGVYDYNYVSSFDGSTQPAEHIQEGKDTSGLGSTINYLITLLIVGIVIFIIFRLLQGAFLKGTYDNIYSQAKGDKSIKVAGLALILTVLTYATLSFIYPGLTGWSVSTDYTANVSGGGVYGNTIGMCGIQVSGNGPCQDTDANNPFSNTSDPRGLRNNNPGNIRQSASNNWYGICLKQSDSAFVQFKNAESGIRAMAKLLINYQQDKKLDTIAKIINTWAPGSDNNNPNSYASVVAKNMGIGVNDLLPDLSKDLSKTGAIFKFIQGITQVENGNKQAYSDDTILKGLSTANQDLSGGATCTSSASPYLANQSSLAGSNSCVNLVKNLKSSDLVSVIGKIPCNENKDNPNRCMVQKKYLDSLISLNNAYKAKFGREIEITSSYRNQDYQNILCSQTAGACAQNCSNHMTGLAVDFTNQTIGNCKKEGTCSSDEFEWLKEHGDEFGEGFKNQLGNEDNIHWSYNGH